MNKFIVIGAGILGASAAYHLARKGAEVTVIDRHDAGQATDAAAGIICPWLSQRRNKAWYALAKGGAAYYETLAIMLEEDGEADTGYKKVGAISIHADADKLEKMAARAVLRRETAPEIGEIMQLGPEETAALFPPLSKEFASVKVSGAARVNGRALRNALILGAKKNGAEFVQASAKLEQNGSRVTAVLADGQRYEASAIIVTAGAWAAELFAPLGIDLAVTSQKAQIIHLQLEDTDTRGWPVVMPPNDQYIVAFDEGRVVIGATHENEMDFDLRVTAGGLHEVLDKALNAVPGLAEGTFLEARVGYRPFTPGFLPVIGTVPGHQNLLFANGLGASGLTAGPFLGAELAKLALGEHLDIDLSLYEVAKAIR
ncbi:NAD(P)/FAD-dependent oxidoreductase [Mesobacillus zeae]|uniref:FAD-binding oxidoreductase n=1 Tax=Mesobacillus zeae TaxID=1917180 RepID=A0A398BGR7_9BACI|nr:FAD-dependent oxidoreductase [Mesobacillus zeae]RID86776.1 FAD-binding oxidoreductase [Mesobacillus zeae]